jgi:hypothetical protein
MEYDNRGKIALWRKKEEDSEKAPDLKGHFFAHRDIKEGEIVDVALWRDNNANPNSPAVSGKVSDKRKADEAAPAGVTTAPDYDDDIPF